jgi:RNA polymerase sigma-70 factor, ECF subfamily
LVLSRNRDDRPLTLFALLPILHHYDHRGSSKLELSGTAPVVEHVTVTTEAFENDLALAARFEREAIPLLHELHGAARWLTRNGADAEDLVQDTIVKAYTKFHLLREGPHLRAWLYRIMHNTWLNNHRKTRRRPTEHLNAEITDWQQAAWRQHHNMATCRSAEAHVLEALPDREIVEALESLPESFRITVYYADVHGYRYREIAEIMEVPIGTVTSRLYSARRRLRELLAYSAHDHGPVTSR